MSCERLRSLWETFLDGELPSRQMLELQAHLDGCGECTEAVALSQAIRHSARQLVREDVVISDEFRARISNALVMEARAEREQQNSLRGKRWRELAPRWGFAAVTVAAGFVLWIRPDQPTPHADAPIERQSVAMGAEELLDRFIDYHTAPPTPQVTEPKLVPEMERDVGVRVPLLSLTQYGAEWQGGSVVRVRRQPAAYLRYRTTDDHSVTVYVYNASRLPLHAGLTPRMFREEPVYEGYRRGYTIAAQLRHGVGYAVATDLNEARSAELVRAITSSAVTH
jgi:anti-sigma factor RsiW